MAGRVRDPYRQAQCGYKKSSLDYNYEDSLKWAPNKSHSPALIQIWAPNMSRRPWSR